MYSYEKDAGLKPLLDDDCYGEVIGIDNLSAGNQYFVVSCFPSR